MARSPFRVELTIDQRRAAESWTRGYTGPYWQVVPPKLVLMAADGAPNTEIAEWLGTSPQVLHPWRRRLCKQGHRRPGRP